MTWQPQLTQHELAALQLLAAGLHHVEIAKRLHVSPTTAGQLLYGAQISLHARTLPHTIARGYETGILHPAPLKPADQHRSPPAP
ncbi:LuxR C-terminal-related transcriptional regulator [Streptomyces sp. NPDC048638]|uniref:LuxR C-terminal-related transcriptional regulator n=1 Tax=Streptomyces sp. NPDC048638 TaxID=3365580 RepID=UPI0037100086